MKAVVHAMAAVATLAIALTPYSGFHIVTTSVAWARPALTSRAANNVSNVGGADAVCDWRCTR